MYMPQYFNFFLFFYFFAFLFLDLLDLEDIGVAMRKQKQTEKKAKEASLRLEARDGGREMVTKLLLLSFLFVSVFS